jgi:hypothetical protein
MAVVMPIVVVGMEEDGFVGEKKSCRIDEGTRLA